MSTLQSIKSRRYIIASVVGVLVLMLGLLPAWSTPKRPPIRKKQELVTGKEVVYVLLGATFCHGAASEDFRVAVTSAESLVQAQALAHGHQFHTVGIALDWSTDDGMTFLKRFGTFDEALLGANWKGTGAVKYVWHDFPGEPD